VKVIRGWANPEFKALRKRLKPGFGSAEMAVEGPKLIAEAMRAGLRPTELWTDGEPLADLDCPQYRLSSAHYQKISAAKTGQPPLAIFPAPALPEADAADLSRGRWLLLDRLQDPGNAGSLVRAAAAFDFDGVLWRVPCVYPFHHGCIRASAGAAFHLPMRLWTERAATLCRLPLIGTDADAPFALDEFDWPEDLALAMGNEGHGLSPELVGALSARVRAPISGRVESLNVAGAGHVLMFWLYRQRLKRKAGPPPV